MRNMIENYLNGNISDARRLAKRFKFMDIRTALIEQWGFSENKATLTANHIKTGERWQEACDAV